MSRILEALKQLEARRPEKAPGPMRDREPNEIISEPGPVPLEPERPKPPAEAEVADEAGGGDPPRETLEQTLPERRSAREFDSESVPMELASPTAELAIVPDDIADGTPEEPVGERIAANGAASDSVVEEPFAEEGANPALADSEMIATDGRPEDCAAPGDERGPMEPIEPAGQEEQAGSRGVAADDVASELAGKDALSAVDAVGETAAGGLPETGDERIAALGANLLADLPADRPAVVLFTSADAAVGKTATVAELARWFARRIEGGVLAVDVNLRRPGLAEALGVDTGPGLSAVMAGTIDWQDAVRLATSDGLDVLPAGGEDVREGVDLVAFSVAMEQFREHYRMVLLDAASLTEAEVAPLARLCDGTCLVLRLGQTTQMDAEAAVEILRSAEARLLGCIVTDAAEEAAR